MKTVADFKEAGLVFVEGDLCVDGCKAIYKDEWFRSANKGEDDFSLDTMTKFAWRDNTGEKPSFNGKIEVEFGSGNIGVGDANDWSWLPLDYVTDTYDIIKWRPAIGQKATPEQDAEPVFTHGMSDAGKLPPIGSKFRIHTDHWFMVGSGASGGVVGERCSDGELRKFHSSKCKPIKTEQELLIDAAIAELPEPCDAETVAAMIELGYRKETN